jgi:hypothetical protein
MSIANHVGTETRHLHSIIVPPLTTAVAQLDSAELEWPLHLVNPVVSHWECGPTLPASSSQQDRLDRLCVYQKIQTQRYVLDVVKIVFELFLGFLH